MSPLNRVFLSRNVQDYIPIYLENRRQDLFDLEQALAVKNWEFIRQTGHRLSGSGASFGLDFISEFGKNLEQLSLPLKEEKVRVLLSELANYLEHLEIIYE